MFSVKLGHVSSQLTPLLAASSFLGAVLSRGHPIQPDTLSSRSCPILSTFIAEYYIFSLKELLEEVKSYQIMFSDFYLFMQRLLGVCDASLSHQIWANWS